MPGMLLHIVTFTPHSAQDVPAALRMLRHLLPRSGGEDRAALLFCDLPDAPGERMPQDAELLSLLQSGVMAMDARSPGRFMLLARRRAWDDAARTYLGAGQKKTVRSVIADLLLKGGTDTAFDAATVAPASLREAYDAALFSPLALSCTPDTPARMLAALKASPCGAVAAAVYPSRSYPRSALSRLEQCGFSLSPLALHEEIRLQRSGFAPGDAPDTPVLFARSALQSLPDAVPLAKDCFFVRREGASLPALLRAHHAACLRRCDARALLAPAQLALLFAAALLGSGLLALLALLPEGFVLLAPRQLPGALARLSLLPITASVSLDALLMRLFARSPAFRLRVPAFLLHARGCVLLGALLLLAAVRGTQALAPLLPISLLWLAAPLILPALASPTIERTPLTAEQRTRLRAQAESAFFDALGDDHSAPERRMLAACTGCMLRLLEPDEAARRTQALLDEAAAQQGQNSSKKTAADAAAVLVCAQYLREEMGQCDAALRELPQRLEAFALAMDMPEESDALGCLLRAARGEDSAVPPQSAPSGASPLDALFLPLAPARDMARHALTLPLTHPHTYLLLEDRKEATQADGARECPPQARSTDRFLALAAAALAHPFHPLLMRSPIAGPYAALLAV